MPEETNRAEGLFVGTSVESKRVLYTPSAFARTSLLYLQEVGTLKALAPHISRRDNLTSYLCFVVREGAGELSYAGRQYPLQQGDVVFIDCKNSYAHSTGDKLWTLSWCHFFGAGLAGIYDKYIERGGQPVFRPADQAAPYMRILQELYSVAESEDYIRDMRINTLLNELLMHIMEESWHPELHRDAPKRSEVVKVKEYLDDHYKERVTLEELASVHFLSKFYLAQIFKDTYGITVGNYVTEKRIAEAKRLLRFGRNEGRLLTIQEVAAAVGYEDMNYFCRTFKKTEGMSPGEYRKRW